MFDAATCVVARTAGKVTVARSVRRRDDPRRDAANHHGCAVAAATHDVVRVTAITLRWARNGRLGGKDAGLDAGTNDGVEECNQSNG